MQKLVALPPSTFSSSSSPTTSLLTSPLASPKTPLLNPLRRTISLDESFYKIEEKKDKLERGPVKVYDYLYLGSRADTLHGSKNVARLKALGISYIIDCAKEYREMREKRARRRRISEADKDFKTLHLDLYDDERIVQQFRGEAERAIQFIKDIALQNKKVLVCCHLGTSRSAGIVLAYMMRKQDLDYSTALGQLRNLCAGTDQVILPNQYIEDMLQMWE